MVKILRLLLLAVRWCVAHLLWAFRVPCNQLNIVRKAQSTWVLLILTLCHKAELISRWFLSSLDSNGLHAHQRHLSLKWRLKWGQYRGSYTLVPPSTLWPNISPGPRSFFVPERDKISATIIWRNVRTNWSKDWYGSKLTPWFSDEMLKQLHVGVI